MLPSKICRSVVAVPAAVTAAWTQLALAKSAAFFGKSMKSPKESMKSRTILYYSDSSTTSSKILYYISDICIMHIIIYVDMLATSLFMITLPSER